MKSICPRFGNLGNDSTGVAPIFSGKVAGQNFEFLNRVGIRVVHHAVGQEIIIEAAVEHESVRIAAPSADAKCQSGAQVALPIAWIVVWKNSGLQRHETQRMTAVQG